MITLMKIRREIKIMAEWISAEDRLPEYGIKVIVCRKNGTVEQGYKDVGDWWRVYGTRTKSVTHWMPMPEPPELS